MPQRIIGVSKRLIEAARDEFLEKRFEGASIRIIAKKADTSPRAVYTRFENKEELFAAVVEPAAENFMKMFREDKIIYWEKAGKRDFSEKPEDTYKRYLDYAYKHRTEFSLILKASKGTRYEKFTKNLAEIDIQNVRENLPNIVEGISIKDYDEPTRMFLENITIAFYDAIFKPLVDGTSLDIAKLYISKLTRFYSDGIMAGLKSFGVSNDLV